MNDHSETFHHEDSAPARPRRSSRQKAETRYRELFDHVPVGLYQTTPDGQILDANPAFVQMLGFPDRAALLAMSAWQLYVDPKARSEWQARMAPDGLVRHFEVQLRRHDGGAIWVRESTRAVTGGAGRVRYYEGSLEDISEQKLSAAALYHSEERLSAVINAAPLVLWSVDRNGIFTSSEGKGLEILGLRRGEVVGRSVAEVYEQQPKLIQWIAEALQGQRRRWIAEIGGSAWDTYVATVPDEAGEIGGLIAVSMDITERMRAEEALQQTQQQLLLAQKMEAIGRLAGGIAHDFNNLLMVVTGYSDLLMERLPSDSAARRDVDEIVRATERAAGLTHQLLAFSRRQVLQPRVLDLNFVVADMDKMLQRVIGEDIELSTLTGLSSGRVLADRGQIEQIVMNLAVNARDAMPGGGRLILETADVELDDLYVRRHANVQPGPYVRLAVSDTGCGMEPAVLARIFEPFFTTKPQGKGSGLGLSTVYGIVQQSGGTVWVYSETGRGTTFKIYLPRVDEPLAELSPPPMQAPVARGSETILVVEDEEKVRSLVREILERFGYQVVEASGGQEALELCRTYGQDIDLMLTDVVMPGLGGRELAVQVTAIRPRMKVLFMSGYTDRGVSDQTFLDPGVAFLEKPFTFSTLTQKLRELLGS